jgi:hypothetical protein
MVWVDLDLANPLRHGREIAGGVDGEGRPTLSQRDVARMLGTPGDPMPLTTYATREQRSATSQLNILVQMLDVLGLEFRGQVRRRAR